MWARNQETYIQARWLCLFFNNFAISHAWTSQPKSIRHKFDEDLLLVSKEMCLELKLRIWVSLNTQHYVERVVYVQRKIKSTIISSFFWFDRYRDENDHDTRIKYRANIIFIFHRIFFFTNHIFTILTISLY